MRVIQMLGVPLVGASLVTAGLMTAATPARAQVVLSVGFAPPPLPVYVQPPIPAEGYIWTPGYWNYADVGYYWVPGVWVQPPSVGVLWTPGYWGWGGGQYLFHGGYWGPHVGFYGGVNYGFGYGGFGYEGGYWQGGRLFYNRNVTNITNVRITNVYNRTVINSRPGGVAFNGGNGGIQVQPRAAEQAAMAERHIQPVAAQSRIVEVARANPQFHASVNHGQVPANVAALRSPAEIGHIAAPANAARSGLAPAARPGLAGAGTRPPLAGASSGYSHTAQHPPLAPHYATPNAGAYHPGPTAAPYAHPGMASRPMPMAPRPIGPGPGARPPGPGPGARPPGPGAGPGPRGPGPHHPPG